MEPTSKRRSSSMFGLTPMTEDFSMDIPNTTPDDTDEKRKRRLSKSKQWKEVREYLLGRRTMYTKQLPGGAYYRNMSKTDAAHYSAIGDCVIEEIDGFIRFIEGSM